MRELNAPAFICAKHINLHLGLSVALGYMVDHIPHSLTKIDNGLLFSVSYCDKSTTLLAILSKTGFNSGDVDCRVLLRNGTWAMQAAQPQPNRCSWISPGRFVMPTQLSLLYAERGGTMLTRLKQSFPPRPWLSGQSTFCDRHSRSVLPNMAF